MHNVHDNVLSCIGDTPVVRLQKVARGLASHVYVKLEYLNPGGSMKDRIAIQIIDDAEKAGLLKPGGTIVEATSGNTGAGLALVAAIRGYTCIFVLPDKQSEEKRAALRAYGAKVVITPTDVEPEDPRSYYSTAKRIAQETPNAFYANQYHNPSNPQAHYRWTGPELWKQMDGRIDAFVAGLGTGGTISGIARYRRSRSRARSGSSGSIRSARSTTTTSAPGSSRSRSRTWWKGSARTSFRPRWTFRSSTRSCA